MSAKKIVIIDDSKYVVDKLVKFFTEQLRCTVVATAHDGTAAVELYKRHRPDLLVLDVMMEKMDGVTALAEVLKEDPGANIIMVSAVRGDSMLRCMVLGAKGYVEKPLNLDEPGYTADFTATIKEVLGVST